MDNNGHHCITGVIASPVCFYKNDERPYYEYGRINFNYCPICGMATRAIALSDQVRALVAEYGTDAVMAAAGRM